MKFHIRPILKEIKDLYLMPSSTERFQEYISKLQDGTKGELNLPISGFNPMAKKHILLKIEALEKFEAEKLMEETIFDFNSTLAELNSEVFLVVLNIADDLKGAWTNYYATDFDSKFKLNAFVKRKFCVPYFWTSESYSKEIIRDRTLEYLYRTLYRMQNPQPKTLEEHLEQEIFVASLNNREPTPYKETSIEEVEKYYLKHKNSEEYERIFNFFYGDEGSRSLGYKNFGITELRGYNYAKIISNRRKTRS